MKKDDGGQKTNTITPPPSNQVIAQCCVQIISHSILKIGEGTTLLEPHARDS